MKKIWYKQNNERVNFSIEKINERLNPFIEMNNKQAEKRDEKQRRFTLNMFTIAISISIMGVFGTFLKSFGFI